LASADNSPPLFGAINAVMVVDPLLLFGLKVRLNPNLENPPPVIDVLLLKM
jgi:hypothetical protein